MSNIKLSLVAIWLSVLACGCQFANGLGALDRFLPTAPACQQFGVAAVELVNLTLLRGRKAAQVCDLPAQPVISARLSLRSLLMTGGCWFARVAQQFIVANTTNASSSRVFRADRFVLKAFLQSFDS